MHTPDTPTSPPNAAPRRSRTPWGRMSLWLTTLGLALALGIGVPVALLPDGSLWAQTGTSTPPASSASDAEEADTEDSDTSDTEDSDEADAEETPAPVNGYIYTVRSGDSWPVVAQRTGVSEAALRAANPDKERETGWLIEGEELLIPVVASTPQRVHEVAVGESWSSIAARYNVPVSLLQAANPRAVRAGLLLYRGERLVIPPPPPTAAPADSAGEDVDEDMAEDTDAQDAAAGTPVPTVAPTVAPTATPTAEPTEEPAPTAAPTEEPTEEPTAEPTEEPSPEPTATPAEEPVEETDTEAETDTETDEDTGTAAAVDIPACPTRFLDYPQAMTTALNADPAVGPATLQTFLTTCEALAADGFVVQDLTGNGIDDVVVLYQNPTVETIFVESDLAIFNGSEEGYELVYRARAAGEVRLVTVDDINDDEQIDVVWVDTTCGASTCFDTVNVRSWTDPTWSDWTEGTITMAYAAVELATLTDLVIPAQAVADDETDMSADEDVSADEEAEESEEEGEDAPGPQVTGDSIVVMGGIYGSVGAGPQRSRTEVWASVDGAPYALVEREYMESDCLYHVVIDANAALLEGWADNFAQAEALYRRAATDTDLLTCWVRENEAVELRSFSQFRLALIAGYRDDLETATERAETVVDTYPDEVYEAVAAIWLREFRNTGSAAEACAVVTQYAEQTPATWELLADYGYTNPSFEAVDVCPILAPPDPDPDAEAGDEAEEDGAGTDEENEETDENAGAPEGALASFPECPADLSGYADAINQALNIAAGDGDAIEAWLTACRAMDSTRGAVRLADITGDGREDAVVFPVLVTDLGFGPGGAQGATLIYHATAPDAYTLLAAPEIYGKPEPLVIADLNDDGQTEVAWTVTGCSTFCVTEVQMYKWTGSEYLPAILPGATMANAEISFEPVNPGDADGAQRLVLYGGVSGTADGGIETPHWEEWQSIEGGPYQRVRWEYDRSVEGNTCLGLRLIEADVALQAAPQIGYAPAQELYLNALADLAADDLEACSIMEMNPATELDLLQGLATLRLLQIYGLTGDLDEGATLLDEFETHGPDTDYVTIARTWWDTFTASLESGAATAAALAACEAILPTLEDTPRLWQVTDQYGYNHPVLAAEQICYVP